MLMFAKAIEQRHGFSSRRFGQAVIMVLLLLVSLGLIVTWAGGDPWKSKPYQQWDSKDILKIVNDSPWAKLVRVDAPWKNAPGADDGAGSFRRVGFVPPWAAWAASQAALLRIPEAVARIRKFRKPPFSSVGFPRAQSSRMYCAPPCSPAGQKRKMRRKTSHTRLIRTRC